VAAGYVPAGPAVRRCKSLSRGEIKAKKIPHKKKINDQRRNTGA
jgi:hypothetical protein